MRRLFVLAVFLVLGLAPGAGGASGGGTVVTGAIDVGGVTRTYRLFLPVRLSKPAPVVLVFHGGFGTGAAVAQQTGFDVEAARRGFLAVYPDGIGRTWNAGLCCGLADALDMDDLGFVSKLLDELGTRYRIDSRRVFATGISNGGLFSYVLACRLSGRIAAVAPVAATLDSPCSPELPVSILHVHGLADENIPFGGGPGSRGVAHVDWPPVLSGIERWRQLDGCPGAARTTVRGAVRAATWSPCRASSSVQLVTIAGGGHVWPRSPYDATPEIWRFFAAQPRR